MIIRKATLADIDEIMLVIADAKKLLKASGSLQWNGPDNYPNKDTFLTDIENGTCYIAYIDKVVGVMAVCELPDVSYEAQKEIWQYKTYYSIHRIAVSKEYYHQNIAPNMLEYAHRLAKDNNVESIRVDTHELNKPMQGLLKKLGYKYVGDIKLIHSKIDNIRLAYEKKI